MKSCAALMKNAAVVAGGGAIDMELSPHLRDTRAASRASSSCFINAFAKALEVIPRQLCDNSGLTRRTC